MPLTVDIETVPLLSSLTLPYPQNERYPPANYKADEAISKWYASDRDKWEKECAKSYSVNPRLGRIVCLGTAIDADPVTTTIAATEADEADLLRTFWAHAEASHGHMVTWNGGFDLRFLLIRSLAHQIVPPYSAGFCAEWFAKYKRTTHYDCKLALTNDVMSKEGLDTWAAFFGLTGKTAGVSGADVFPMHQQGRHAEIAAYCAQDVDTTRTIYTRIKDVL
jgi:predicted PolB exonuclease-like 3'-5' exonuclease